jgi:hypothetical protein
MFYNGPIDPDDLMTTMTLCGPDDLLFSMTCWQLPYWPCDLLTLMT